MLPSPGLSVSHDLKRPLTVCLPRSSQDWTVIWPKLRGMEHSSFLSEVLCGFSSFRPLFELHPGCYQTCSLPF